MPKLVALILIPIFIVTGIYLIFKFSKAPIEEVKTPPKKEIEEKEYQPSERAETFSISGKESFPKFVKEIVIDPSVGVKEGEKQFISIWVEDPQGIKKVSVNLFMVEYEYNLELKLVGGTEQNGKWTTSWITKDISIGAIYRLKFEAESTEGKTNSLTLFWQNRKIE